MLVECRVECCAYFTVMCHSGDSAMSSLPTDKESGKWVLNMATAVDEVREVMVTGQLVPIQEINRVTKAVCLLKPSSEGPR